MRTLHLLTCFAVLLAVSGTAASAQAQEQPQTPAIDQPVPPRLREFVPAKLEREPAEPVKVLFELLIDEHGQVAEASVIESGGAEYDAAALEAVKRFEFDPAQVSGKPVAVKLRYAYVFEARARAASDASAESAATEPTPAPTAPPPINAPPPAAPRPNEDTGATPPELEEFETTASVEAPPREVTRRSVSQETITRLPGTRGDTLRAIEIMPGVARTSISDGTPILRGSAFNETQAYLNGIPVPFLYHFGGITSFLSPRVVDRVELYPGNFSARYGRIAGGAIDVRTRDPESKRLRAAIDLNVVDSSAFVESPLGERAGIALAARRSNIDFFFKNFVPDDAYSVVAAPLYYDYQLLAFYRLDSVTRLRLLGYGSRDSLQFFFANPNGADPVISGNLDAKLEFYRAGLELESRPSRGIGGSVSATVGYLDQQAHIGEIFQEIHGYEILSRAEASVELDPSLRLTAGADGLAWFTAGKYRGPAPGQTEGDPAANSGFSSQRVITGEDDSIDFARGGAYVELGYRPVRALLLVPGVRLDYLSDTEAAAWDPRLSARYELSPSTTLKAGIGSYSQSPEWWQALSFVGNPRLKFYRALQTSAGIEHRLEKTLKVGVEGFYKRLYGTVVATENGGAPYLENDGRGRIYGAELSLEAHWASRGVAYLAYTLSRSERNEHGGPYHLFDKDQTHILSLVASQGLGKGWEVGARMRLVSGNPITPIVGSVYDARTGVYVPEFGKVNSERDPMFQQLDLRVEKSFHAGPITLAAYLELQNAYNAKNYEGRNYSFDYRTHEAVTGLPLLPNLGLRGEL